MESIKLNVLSLRPVQSLMFSSLPPRAEFKSPLVAPTCEGASKRWFLFSPVHRLRFNHMATLSDGERLFVIHGAQQDCRTDGRTCLQQRPIQLELDVFPLCHGSAHVRVGRTDLVVGVKLQVVEPTDDAPDCGIIEFFADVSANASPEFTGRGGEEIVNELIALLGHCVTPTIDLKALCLRAGHAVWSINVDLLILEFGSKANLLDAAGIGVKAALGRTRLPNVTSDEGEDLELAEESSDLIKLNTSSVPLLVTLTRIGNAYIIDATEEEESSSAGSFVLAIDPSGCVVHCRKLGSGAVLQDPLRSNWRVSVYLLYLSPSHIYLVY